MTHQILRRYVPDQDALERLIKRHIAELTSYDEHMLAVQRGRAQYYPPPQAHPDIDKAIRRDPQPDGTTNFIMDYKLVDYLPVPPGDHGALARHKEEVRHHIAQMEHAASHAVLPHAKWAHHGHKYKDAMEKIQHVVVKVQKVENGVPVFLDDGSKLMMEKVEIQDDRTAEEKDFCDHHEKCHAQLKKVQRHHAKLQAELEDLDFTTVNDWKPTPFAHS